MPTPIALNHCIVYVWLKDILNTDIGLLNAAILSVSNLKPFISGDSTVAPFNKSIAFDSNGFAQIELLETQTPGVDLVFGISYQIGKTVKEIKFKPAKVPNTGNALLTQFAEILG